MAPPEADLRRRILSIVEDYPGLHLRAVQRRADCTAMVAEYHLNALEHLHLVHSETQDNYRVFFPVDSRRMHLDAREKRWLALFRRPNVLGIVLVLLEHGRVTAAEAAELTGLAASTAYYQISGLRKAGALDEVPGSSDYALTEPERVTAILQAYKPTKDAIADMGRAWARVFDQGKEAKPVEVPDVPLEVMELPRSMQRVYLALVDGGGSQKELRERTGLARRSVYGALRTLMELGLVNEAPRLSDTRTRWYSLAAASDEA